MTTSSTSNESSSDDFKDICSSQHPVVRRKSSLLTRWKKSGLALRRYLYCLERKKSDSSSVEEEESCYKKAKDRKCSEQQCSHAGLMSTYLMSGNSPMSQEKSEELNIQDLSDEDSEIMDCSNVTLVNGKNAISFQNGNCHKDNYYTRMHSGTLSTEYRNGEEFKDCFQNLSPVSMDTLDLEQENHMEDQDCEEKHSSDLEPLDRSLSGLELREEDFHKGDVSYGVNLFKEDKNSISKYPRVNISNNSTENCEISQEHLKNDCNFLRAKNMEKCNIKKSVENDLLNFNSVTEHKPRDTYDLNVNQDPNGCVSGIQCNQLGDKSMSDFCNLSNSNSSHRANKTTGRHCITSHHNPLSVGNSAGGCNSPDIDGHNNSSNTCCCFERYYLPEVKLQEHCFESPGKRCSSNRWCHQDGQCSLPHCDISCNCTNVTKNKGHNPSQACDECHVTSNLIDKDNESFEFFSNCDENDQSTSLQCPSFSNKTVLKKVDNAQSDKNILDKGDNFNRTSLSSDSGMTYSSSICDFADVSSEALKDAGESNVQKSPKRFRKRSKPRTLSKLPDDKASDLSFPNQELEEDIVQLESMLDYSPSGFMSSLSRVRLDSQLSEESTESETLSIGNPGTEDTDTTDSIPGLNYAMPYLSDRLKTSLAQRIGLGDIDLNTDITKQQNDEKKNKKQSTECKKQELHKRTNSNGFMQGGEIKENATGTGQPIQGRELLSNLATGGEYMSDERSLSDLLFNMDKIDMIDRIFLREDHSQDLARISDIDAPFHVTGLTERQPQTLEMDTDDGEADDEFECDCQFCVRPRSIQSEVSSLDNEESQSDSIIPVDEAAMAQSAEDDGFNMWMTERDDEENMFTINIEELSPLDLLVNNRRSELELMFENVILQMLAVHPDLLNDQAPPPASSLTIQNLPSTPVTSQITIQNLSCPICLCVYEETDSMMTLPCQHSFHPLCIQAWLNKSGTCPVCRFVL